jgi:hypothetical protein
MVKINTAQGLQTPFGFTPVNPLPNGGSLSQRLKLDYYNVGAIPKHQVNWNLIYDLPFGRGKAFGRSASVSFSL